jgi:translation elongation factor EF-1beta
MIAGKLGILMFAVPVVLKDRDSKMGKVLTLLTVVPENQGEIEKILEDLKKINGFNSGRIEDYVFGTKAIKVSFICDDSEARDFEEEISKIKGVSSVSVEEVGLI